MINILLFLILVVSTIDMVLNFFIFMQRENEPVKVIFNKAVGIKKSAFIPHKDPNNQLDGMIGPNFEL